MSITFNNFLLLKLGWMHGVVVSVWSHSSSCSTLGTVTTWMGECLLTGKLSRYIPSLLGQLSPGLEKIEIFLKKSKKSDFFDLNQIFLI